ncbi:MAG TPA: bifunctional nuclease family protein [Chloroflexi bacterium]|nr:bifunctional nuclease family protein [Chloroflexota bacterium]
MSEMIEVVIDSIRVSLMNQQRIVILREVDQERYLAIWVGVYEAEHLTIALQEVEVARPLTYNLFTSILKSLNARILQVEVVALRNETYYGNIVLEANGQIFNIDARPSDAINLAARANVPILVARDVMDAAGIIPDEDEVNDETPFAEGEENPEPGQGRLSVFEDFLEQLNLDDSGDDEDEATDDD